MSFNIEVRRDALSSADKTLTCQIDISKLNSLDDLAYYLINIGFLPQPTKDEEFWCVGSLWVRYPWKDEPDHKQEIFNELGRIDKQKRTFFAGNIIEFLPHDSMYILIKFFPDSITRAKYIFKLYDGSIRWMYNDGFDSEYLSYNVPKEIEKVWEKEINERLV
jgi:hypothetical protein